jgi:cysteine desulfurase
MAYFDYNATTPLNSLGRQALMNALDESWANPSSPYSASARVHNVLENARKQLGIRLKKPPSEIVFTGGATEANNAVIRFLAEQLPTDKTLATSPFEHPSVVEAARHFFQDRVQVLKATKDGLIDLAHLDEVLKGGTVGAVSLMAVNNETGVIQPWQLAAQSCDLAGVLFHCDASQWFGKCPNGEFGNCDFLTGCAHKFGGPKGVGFLALSGNSYGFNAQYGGGQESGKRGGTENVPSILSMVAALEDAESHLDQMNKQAAFRNEFELALEAIFPEVNCIGNSAARVPNTSFVVIPKYENLRYVRKLDLKGFQVSTGSACSTGETSTSPVLTALGYPSDDGRRSIRISSGPLTSEADWKGLTEAMVAVWRSLEEGGGSNGSEVISL